MNESGETADVRLLSGHPLLARAALDAVKTWRFALPGGRLEPGRKFETMFEFAFSGTVPQLPDNAAETNVETRTFHRLRVTTPNQSESEAVRCPPTRTVRPPLSQTPRDFVQLSRTACFGFCPVYTVRVFRDGSVEWVGQQNVAVVGQRRAKADPALLEAVMNQMGSERFWSLCGLYTRLVTDNPSYTLNGEPRRSGEGSYRLRRFGAGVGSRPFPSC